MSNSITAYFRCPADSVSLIEPSGLSGKKGYFRFGEKILFGSCAGAVPADSSMEALPDLSSEVRFEGRDIGLPFDVDEVADNLRKELYVGAKSTVGLKSMAASLYYAARPLLPVAFRKHLQKLRLRGWEKIKFPHWPVDRTVDNLMEHLLLLAVENSSASEVPFIWFWPEGASGSALVTHDVETAAGVELCKMLMDVNDTYGIKASFQVIPEERYHVTSAFLTSIRDRGFEVVVHDLNHDGRLFRDRDQFVERAAKINAYGKKFGAAGFRAGVLYRNQSWFDALDFEFDMSVPNVAHLDPQHGGCCTVMPFFVGHVLELPVTMTQDYTLFHILNDYSTDLWKRQAELILEKHGLISVVVHPDYITGAREKRVYEALLTHLVDLKSTHNVWIATPSDVNLWWRQRAAMTLVKRDGQFRIEGAGSERASIAYASKKNGRLSFDVQPACRV